MRSLRSFAASFPSEVAIGALVTTLLICSKLYFEHTETGRAHALFTFAWLQERLSPFDPAGMPVVVVDTTTIGVGTLERPTPRFDLGQLISAIAIHHPKAIGVDIDFSPTETGWVTDEDPEFFDECLRISKRYNVPIFLGVGRSSEGTPSGFLGRPEYEHMAVRASGTLRGEERKMAGVPLWFSTKTSDHLLPNLPVALALAYLEGATRPRPRWNLGGFVEAISLDPPAPPRDSKQRTEKGGWMGEAPVNYSKLDQISQQKLYVAKRDFNLPKDRVGGKIVILGAADERRTPDVFLPPGHPITAGVLFHAVAAYTLAIDPVYELKPGVRLLLDAGISGSTIIFLAWLRRRTLRRAQSASLLGHQGQATKLFWLERIVILVFVGSILLAGVWLVRYANVLWLDFLLVAFCVALHRPVAAWLEHVQLRQASG